MRESLHPFTLGEILDRTAQLYRSRFLVYFGIGVMPAGTVLVFAAATFGFLAWIGSSAKAGNGLSTQTVVTLVFLGFVGLLALPAFVGTSALGWGAMTVAAARSYLGEPISIMDSYKTAWKRGWHYTGLYLLLALVVVVAPIVAFVLFMTMGAGLSVLAKGSGLGGSADFLFGLCLFLMAILLGAYALLMALSLCLAYPASVVEQIGAWGAMKRAWRLTKGTKGRIFLLFLLGMVLSWMLTLAVCIPLFIGLAMIPALSGAKHSDQLGQIYMLAWYGMSFAVQAFTKPVFGIALTLFYFDQRIRKEGFDIEWMMQQAGMVEAAQPQVEAVPWLAGVGQGVAQESPIVSMENEASSVSQPEKIQHLGDSG